MRSGLLQLAAYAAAALGANVGSSTPLVEVYHPPRRDFSDDTPRRRRRLKAFKRYERHMQLSGRKLAKRFAKGLRIRGY